MLAIIRSHASIAPNITTTVGKAHYTFGEDDYDVVRYIYADKKVGSYFTVTGE